MVWHPFRSCNDVVNSPTVTVLHSCIGFYPGVGGGRGGEGGGGGAREKVSPKPSLKMNLSPQSDIIR